MKNSLFKRVIAAAAAVPMALTQCPTFTNAATTNAVQGTAQVQAEAKQKLTLEDLLYVAPENEKGSWNTALTMGLAGIAKSGEINVPVLGEEITKRAGNYADVAQEVIDLIKNVKYEISGNDFTLTGEVDEPDFNEIIKSQLDSSKAPKSTEGRSNAPAKFDASMLPEGIDIEELKTFDLTTIPKETRQDLAKKYDIPELASDDVKTIKDLTSLKEKEISDDTVKDIAQEVVAIKFSDIDFSGTKIGGKFTFVLKGSDLKAGTTVRGLFKYECNDGKTYYLGQLPAFAKDSLKAIKEAGDKGIQENFKDQKSLADTLQSKFDEKIDKFLKYANRADAFIEQGGTQAHHKEPGTTANVIKKANEWLKKHNLDKELPASATDIAANSTVLKYYQKALNKAGERIDISAEDIGKFADSLYEIVLDNKGEGLKGTAVAKFAESEREITELKTYLKGLGYEYVSSYKKLTLEGDMTKSKTENFGKADLQIERVLVTNTTTTSPTTTSTTTTTTTTTTTEPKVTTKILSAYMTADVKTGYYFNIEEEFDKNMISNVKLFTRYQEGYTVDGQLVIKGEGTKDGETPDMSKINFGKATPANTYSKDNAKFSYDIPVYYGDVQLTDEFDIPFVVKVYIGVKGDTNLDGIADAVDASQVLKYYAKLSTGGKPDTVPLSQSAKVNGNPKSPFENLTAFLSDVTSTAEETVDRYAVKGDRTCDAVDASRILKFYTKRSSSDYKDKTDKELWTIVDTIKTSEKTSDSSKS